MSVVNFEFEFKKRIGSNTHCKKQNEERTAPKQNNLQNHTETHTFRTHILHNRKYTNVRQCFFLFKSAENIADSPANVLV